MPIYDYQCHTPGQADRDMAETTKRITDHLAADPAARFTLRIVLDLHQPTSTDDPAASTSTE